MDKRKLFVSILAGFMALVMLFGLVAMFIPTKAQAAKKSSEIKAQIEKLKEEKVQIEEQIKGIKGDIKSNNKEMKERKYLKK